MEKKCISAIKCNDNIVLYRVDLTPKELNQFLKNNQKYLECEETSSGNIYFDGKIFLGEWNKYNVKSLTNDFVPEDFIKIGEYYDDNFGRLLFKNCIGLAKFKNITFNIESPKISMEELYELADVVNGYISNLSYDYNQPTYSNIDRDVKEKIDINYHVYLLVYNFLSNTKPDKNFFSNFNLIKNNPCRTMISNVRYEDIALVEGLTDEAVMNIFSGASNLKLYYGNKIKLSKKLSISGQKYLPSDIMSEETIDTFDNPENRFIKFYIEICLKVISDFQKKFLENEMFINYELLENNEKYIKKLKILLNQSFLKNVGIMQSIPMYSNVLTRRDGYRQIFHQYLGIRSMPIIDADLSNVKELLENKPLDNLYENYCYFTISDILSNIYGEKLEKKKYRVNKTEYSKTLTKKTNSNYFLFDRTEILPKIKVHYNKNYIKESYSKSYDPDISIEIFDINNKLNAIYVLDAKFKANIYEANNDDEYSTIKKYKYDDISKMHTYKDAIVKVLGAFILYPGTENRIFYQDETEISRKLFIGVGAFKLNPGNKDDVIYIKTYLEKLLRGYKLKGC